MTAENSKRILWSTWQRWLSFENRGNPVMEKARFLLQFDFLAILSKMKVGQGDFSIGKLPFFLPLLFFWRTKTQTRVRSERSNQTPADWCSIWMRSIGDALSGDTASVCFNQRYQRRFNRIDGHFAQGSIRINKFFFAWQMWYTFNMPPLNKFTI